MSAYPGAERPRASSSYDSPTDSSEKTDVPGAANTRTSTREVMKTRQNIQTGSAPEGVPALVRLKRYCELTGETADAVHARRKKGQWADGVHCRLGPDHRVWVDVEAAQSWVRGVR